MTRTEALEAFFAAVDAYMPHDALIGRDAIRSAGLAYANAAAMEAIESCFKASISQSDARHLLDGVTATPQPQTEGLRLVRPSDTENTQ